MKFYLSAFVLCAVIVSACNKDKFTTIPQVKIKSISPDSVFQGNIISLKGSYTDKQGDIDSVFIVYKWYNNATAVKNDTFRYPFSALNVPSGTTEADLEVNFQYNSFNPGGIVTLPGVSLRDTSATLGIILIDKAANRSEYKESNRIRLKKT